jgi:AraC-like DNA-binding protein
VILLTKDLIFLHYEDSSQPFDGFYFPPYISLAHIFNAPKGWSTFSKKFRQYQFQYVLSGKALYRIEDRHYETNKGDLILHYPNEDHEVQTLEDHPYVCVSIVFHFGQRIFPLEDMLNKKHYIGNFENMRLETALTNLAADYHQPHKLLRLRAQATLMEVIYTVLEKHQEESLESLAILNPQKVHANIILLKNYMMEHFRKEITYEDLMELTYWSKNYINRRFKHIYGITPMQYQIQLRVEEAKKLAIQSNMTYSEIAQNVGYSDVHSFGKMFKRKTGFSLSQFCHSLAHPLS